MGHSEAPPLYQEKDLQGKYIKKKHTVPEGSPSGESFDRRFEQKKQRGRHSMGGKKGAARCKKKKEGTGSPLERSRRQ